MFEARSCAVIVLRVRRDRCVNDWFRLWRCSVKMQISPLRCAAVEMTLLLMGESYFAFLALAFDEGIDVVGGEIAIAFLLAAGP